MFLLQEGFPYGIHEQRCLILFPFDRQEMLQVREKQKEQEVEALKQAMKGGMVSLFCATRHTWYLQILLAYLLFCSFVILGGSNERTSSAQGGDGIYV